MDSDGNAGCAHGFMYSSSFAFEQGTLEGCRIDILLFRTTRAIRVLGRPGRAPQKATQLGNSLQRNQILYLNSCSMSL